MYGTLPETLQRMYIKGSLKNQGNGFVFQIKNLIESGSMSGVAKLAVNGEECELDGATIELGGRVRQVSEITWSTPLYVSYGATLTISVPGLRLPDGEHTLNIQFNVPELGRLSMPITDTVGE